MNYLAHLYFAKPTADSHMGNLLGDFRRGVNTGEYSTAIQDGLKNHQLIDKFTDKHDRVKSSVKLFKPEHQRFAPVAIDILYDHFLTRDWLNYASSNFEQFRQQSYQHLSQRLQIMPTRMQQVVGHMINNDGLSVYQTLERTQQAIKYVAGRIRFDNDFEHCTEDIEQHYDSLLNHFSAFFPELIEHVESHALESEST